MERYVDMKSPFTGGRVKEIRTVEETVFRDEQYMVPVRYYVCEDTGEEFTTTEQDTILFNELYAQYRKRHGIPFPDEMRQLRVGYGLDYSQISRILGFDSNQYARYENGEVPSESNGKLISSLRNKNVFADLLKKAKNLFSATEYDRIFHSIFPA